MEEIVAPVGTVVFDLERDLDQQIGALPLPFGGMDKSGSATCVFHLKGFCNRASMCPYRHIKPDRTIVCKHWLRGLCKKGDSCEFLHEYDMSKMPECYFYSKFRACSNKECPFLHIDPESKIKDCPWYDRGFCRHGPMCRHRHTRRVCCINYLCGFCPDGPACKFVHMRFDIPMLGPPGGPPGATTGPGMLTLTPSMMPNTNGNMITSIGGGGPDSGPGHGGAGHTGPLLTINPNQPGNMMDGRPDRGPKPKGVVICHYCQEPGHKIYVCNAIPPDQRDEVIQKFLLEQQESRKNHQRYGGRGDSGHGGAGGDHHGGGHKDHHNHHSNRENFHPYQRHQNHNAPGGGGHHHNNRQQQPLLLSTIDNNNDSGSQTSENSTTFGSSISTVVGVGGATGPGGPGAGGIGLKEPLLTVPGGGPPLLTVGVPGGRRPLDQVTCFKCGEKGHYANKCPKGYLAFLSPALGNLKRAEPDS